MYRNIVVAYDGSEGAEQALLRAVALAGASGGALNLVASTGHLNYALQGAVAGATGERESDRLSLDEVADRIDEVPTVTRVVEGDPVQGIVDAAEDIHADLIVMGSRGRALMPEAVLGRVTSGVVNQAPCDVLVVEPRP